MRSKALLGVLSAAGLVAIVAACGSSSKSGFGDGTGNGGGGGAGDGDGGNGFGTGTVDAAVGTPTVVAHLTGKVVAPEGTIPISGALVYLAGTTPPPIPTGVYCDKCVEITATTPYTYSKADGTFDLGAFSTGPQTLVVQKGQFRRAWPIQVAGPTQVVPQKSTTLPAKSDPASGDDIPKMAVVQAQWDAIEVSLAKLGLGTVSNTGPFGTPEVKNAPFDIVNASLLSDATKLAQYNIVFAGCSFSQQTTCNTSQPAGDSKVQKNLQDFVAKGGKLYTSDYSYELVRQPWPGFVHWDNETNTLGSACQPGAYDAQAQNVDPGLSSWLTAIGEGPTPTLKQSWTSISSVSSQMGTDQDGKPAMITPKVWMSGMSKPMTVSFQNGCGRVLFSTYHTEGDGASALLAQEKALLYVLLEVGVCVGTLPPPK